MVRMLRSAVFAVWFYAVTLAFCLGGVPVRLFARHRALALAKAWGRTVLAGLGPICGIRIVLTGWDRIPADGPVLLAGQHQSEFDTLVWIALLDHPCYVLKQELTRIPLFGPLLILAGMIPVDRSGGAAAMRTMLQDAVRAAGRSGQIVIFPEGTRVAFGDTAPLQPGVAAIAARTGLPVLPVATDSGRCWPRGLLTKQPGVIRIAIGPPIGSDCRRAAILAEVETFWRSQGNAWQKAVDKSVEEVEASDTRHGI